jgi:hypothetical protein
MFEFFNRVGDILGNSHIRVMRHVVNTFLESYFDKDIEPEFDLKTGTIAAKNICLSQEKINNIISDHNINHLWLETSSIESVTINTKIKPLILNVTVQSPCLAFRINDKRIANDKREVAEEDQDSLNNSLSDDDEDGKITIKSMFDNIFENVVVEINDIHLTLIYNESDTFTIRIKKIEYRNRRLSVESLSVTHKQDSLFIDSLEADMLNLLFSINTVECDLQIGSILTCIDIMKLIEDQKKDETKGQAIDVNVGRFKLIFNTNEVSADHIHITRHSISCQNVISTNLLEVGEFSLNYGTKIMVNLPSGLVYLNPDWLNIYDNVNMILDRIGDRQTTTSSMEVEFSDIDIVVDAKLFYSKYHLQLKGCNLHIDSQFTLMQIHFNELNTDLTIGKDNIKIDFLGDNELIMPRIYVNFIKNPSQHISSDLFGLESLVLPIFSCSTVDYKMKDIFTNLRRQSSHYMEFISPIVRISVDMNYEFDRFDSSSNQKQFQSNTFILKFSKVEIVHNQSLRMSVNDLMTIGHLDGHANYSIQCYCQNLNLHMNDNLVVWKHQVINMDQYREPLLTMSFSGVDFVYFGHVIIINGICVDLNIINRKIEMKKSEASLQRFTANIKDLNFYYNSPNSIFLIWLRNIDIISDKSTNIKLNECDFWFRIKDENESDKCIYLDLGTFMRLENKGCTKIGSISSCEFTIGHQNMIDCQIGDQIEFILNKSHISGLIELVSHFNANIVAKLDFSGSWNQSTVVSPVDDNPDMFVFDMEHTYEVEEDESKTLFDESYDDSFGTIVPEVDKSKDDWELILPDMIKDRASDLIFTIKNPFMTKFWIKDANNGNLELIVYHKRIRYIHYQYSDDWQMLWEIVYYKVCDHLIGSKFKTCVYPKTDKINSIIIDYGTGGYKVKIDIAPFRLGIDQVLIEYMINIFNNINYQTNKKEENKEEKKKKKIDIFSISKIHFLLDINMRNGGDTTLDRNEYWWVFNIPSVKNANISLNSVFMTGIYDKQIISGIAETWIKDWDQVYNLFKGTPMAQPIKLVLELPEMAIELFRIPLNSDNPIKCFQANTFHVGKKITLELLQLSTTSSFTFYKGLDKLDNSLNGGATSPGSGSISMWANQPRNWMEGTKKASNSLYNGFRSAYDMIKSGDINRLPAAILQVPKGITSAVSDLTLGIKNSIDENSFEDSYYLYRT